jgi:hypothetical protein
MTPLEILKTVAIAIVLLFIGVTGFVYLHDFDPILKMASIIALGVVSSACSLVFFYAALQPQIRS